MSDLDRFRSALRQALGEAFLRGGRRLTPEARRDFSERAMAIVAAELGEPPGVELAPVPVAAQSALPVHAVHPVRPRCTACTIPGSAPSKCWIPAPSTD